MIRHRRSTTPSPKSTTTYQQQRDDYNAKLNNYPATRLSTISRAVANVVVVEGDAAGHRRGGGILRRLWSRIRRPMWLSSSNPIPFVQRLVFANPPVVLWKLDMVADQTGSSMRS
jgi:hypothetical protein